ncbi:single-strand selective monofunctional uracil DNA glycosylase-like [Ptychodera flava]|uniref:single-strand selective monofunctional uracil DNA glycosylase-like n=1 Tax=Ptychodera flava TaxID=63121 RepID=UPI00396A2511
MDMQQVKKQKLDHHGDQILDASQCHGNIPKVDAILPGAYGESDASGNPNSKARCESSFCSQISVSNDLCQRNSADDKAASTSENQKQKQGANESRDGPTSTNEIQAETAKNEGAANDETTPGNEKNVCPSETSPATKLSDSTTTAKLEPLPEPKYENSYAEKLLGIEDELCQSLNHLFFYEPVTHVYNPLIYASETHSQFVRKYCKSTKPILFLGMNPGPYGMAQNGVPFGEVTVTQDWLGISGKVGKPFRENPKRPILGFDCTQSEVSGRRFWGFFKNLCKSPETFFKYCYVHNYCPLVFMAVSGKNITPPTIPMIQRMPLMSICDTALCEVIQLLKVKVVVAIGRFVQDRVTHALKDQGIEGVRIEFLMHPSPINAKANKCWDEFAMKQLAESNVLQYIAPTAATKEENEEAK